MSKEIPVGAHLVSPRSGYTHHGIYIGNGLVIHYSGLSHGLKSGAVEETDLEGFCNGHGATVKTYKNSFSAEETITRARSRLGEDSYSVFNNNCEHFCVWCITGSHTSAQVDTATS